MRQNLDVAHTRHAARTINGQRRKYRIFLDCRGNSRRARIAESVACVLRGIAGGTHTHTHQHRCSSMLPH
jgi:hypothetical protein